MADVEPAAPGRTGDPGDLARDGGVQGSTPLALSSPSDLRRARLIERLIEDNPDLQAWGDGTPANWSVPPDVLRFLGTHVRPGMTTLETGAGQTTVAFAVAGARHTCITISPDEAQRIRDCCARIGISTDHVGFIHESSDVALPRGDGIPDTPDLVFLDGAHRYPLPAVDFHYTESRLRVGGLLCVDDWRMPSVRNLHDFLMLEAEWELVGVPGTTSIFRRVAETVVINDCQGQRINQVPF